MSHVTWKGLNAPTERSANALSHKRPAFAHVTGRSVGATSDLNCGSVLEGWELSSSGQLSAIKGSKDGPLRTAPKISMATSERSKNFHGHWVIFLII